jgi:hypothetical protein
MTPASVRTGNQRAIRLVAAVRERFGGDSKTLLPSRFEEG